MAPSDHDLLVETHAVVKRMDAVLFGNGREGLLERTVRLEQGQTDLRYDLERYTEEKVAEVKADTPGKGGQRFAMGAGLLALVTAIVQGILQAGQQ